MASSTNISGVQLPKLIENFAVNFHKSLSDKIEGNFVSSALSVYIVLSMAAYGADGLTSKEIRSILRLPENDEESYNEFRELIQQIDNVPNVTLKVANKIFGSNRLKINDNFNRISSNYFGSSSELLDFSQPNAAGIINKWCSDKTNGKINNIIEDNIINKDTMIILLNAVYFKGNWKSKFKEKNTKYEPFHINEKRIVNVPMMSNVNKFFYKDLKEIDAECIAIPYVNTDLFMIIIVPKNIDGLKHIEKNLEMIPFDYETDLARYSTEVYLTLPKFKVKSTIDMVPHLQEMGIINMFNNKADFSGIFYGPSKVSKIHQKAVIEVNEEGSEAAATTDVVITVRAYVPPIKVKVNKPFIYKIMWKKNILFSGRVINPLDS